MGEILPFCFIEVHTLCEVLIVKSYSFINLLIFLKNQLQLFALVLCKDIIASLLDHLQLWPVHYCSLQYILECFPGQLLAMNERRPFRYTVQKTRSLRLFFSVLFIYLLILLALVANTTNSLFVLSEIFLI